MKAKVLRVYPEAFSYSWADCWCIYVPRVWGNEVIGQGKTSALAWKDAAINVSQTGKP